MSRIKKAIVFLLGVSILASVCYGLWHLALIVLKAFATLQPVVSASLVAGVATILGATTTVMVGRYFERKRELEALYREKKMPIYAGFLKEIFSQFQNGEREDASGPESDMVKVLREWQLQLVLWGGPGVVNAYLNWKDELQRGATARSVFATDRLILAIRAELGNENSGLSKGLFAQMILRHSNLFLKMAKENPGVLLSDVAEEEKRQGLEPE